MKQLPNAVMLCDVGFREVLQIAKKMLALGEKRQLVEMDIVYAVV